METDAIREGENKLRTRHGVWAARILPAINPFCVCVEGF